MSEADSESESVEDLVVKTDLPPFVTDRKNKSKVLAMAEELKAQLATLKQELDELRRLSVSNTGGASSRNNPAPVERVPDFREIREYVTLFDPRIPSCPNAETWVQNIDDTGELQKWSPALRLHCARLSLGGSAKLWFEGCQTTIGSWADFKTEIVKGFPSTKNPIYYHNLLSSRKWKTGETVEEYVYEMLATGRKGGFTEETIVTYITSGLRSYVKRSGMTIGKVATVQELLEELRWIDSVDAVPSTSTSKIPDVGVGAVARSHEGRRSAEPVGEVCFHCREMGHIARSCPKVKCHLCKKDGHMKRDCRSGPKKETREQNPKMMRVMDQKSVFVKNVVVSGITLKALVDTGGRVSTIQEKFAKRVGELKPSHKVLRGFGKKEVTVTSKVSTELEVDGIILPVELQVVPTWVQDTAIILGEDVIDQDRLVMVKRKGDVKFAWERPSEQEKSEPFPTEDGEASGVARMYTFEVKEETTIDQQSLNTDGDHHYSQRLVRLVEQYRDCFALNMREMGCAKSAEMKITLTDEDPVYMKPRKLEYARENVLCEIVGELLDAGIIAETESPYNSQVVLVPKKNNQFRMAVDYRLLNAKTIKDKYPMPDIESCLQKLSGARLFITIDLYSGYYQIPLDRESQSYTAFSTSDGHYRFLRMPFGLANGCAVFQRAMNKIVEVLKKKKIVVVAYIDDLILPGQDEEELLEKFEQLLVVLREEGFTINLRKSHFFKQSVCFLGFEVSVEGVRPGELKTRAVSEFPTPTSVHSVQQFLGLSGFFRRFVQGYSIIAEPLFRLLKKEAEFVWREEQDGAFRRIKQILVERPLLVLYDPSADVELHTDASSVGLAGILLQKREDVWKPVGYFSRKTSKAEAVYHSYELEMLAVVASVERFRPYLIGRFFVLRTDCSAIRDTYAKKEMNPRIARYFLKMLEYDFRIEHRCGTRMQHVDALSRSPVEEPAEVEAVAESVMVLEISNTDFLVSMQRQDERLVEIINKLSRDPLCDEDRQIHDNFVVDSHRLYRRVDGRKCWVVPNAVRWRMVRSYHDEKGHFGEEKVLAMMGESFWFPKMRKYVRSYISACPKYAYFKVKQGKPEGFLNPIPKTPIPFHTVHLDHLGPFPRSSKGNEHILAIVCGFSKFLLAKPVKSTNTQAVITVLEEMSSVFGLPSRIITDRGTAFTSRLFKQYCEDYSIDHVLVAVGTPRGNGQVERSNRTILTALRTMVDEADRRWDEKVKVVQSAINTAPNSTTKVAPTTLVLSYKPKDVVQNEIISAIAAENTTCLAPLEDIRDRVERITRENQVRQKKYFDGRRRAAVNYEVDDLVLVVKDQYIAGGSRKLEPRYKGPLIITEVLPNDRYRVATVPGVSGRPFSTVYSADRMKRWCEAVDLEEVNLAGVGQKNDQEEN